MEDYDEDIVSSYISYLDANNLYGHAMNRPLPYKILNGLILFLLILL